MSSSRTGQPTMPLDPRALRDQVINVASVPHRSPFRYPGGKTWLVPHVRRWMAHQATRPHEFAEPFAGGAIVSLSVVFENLADRATLIELDPGVAAVWNTVLSDDAARLASRIESFVVTHESVRNVLDASPRSTLDRAFATIVRNRTQRGGILAPGASLMKNGENGRGLLSRWYPETLTKRIMAIAGVRDRLTFVYGDGMEYLRDGADRQCTVWFIDPPYTVAGRRLYAHAELDHGRLFKLTANASGDFLMTYDNAEPIRFLAHKHGFQTCTVPMKNTHHAVMTELLIGRDLTWV